MRLFRLQKRRPSKTSAPPSAATAAVDLSSPGYQTFPATSIPGTRSEKRNSMYAVLEQPLDVPREDVYASRFPSTSTTTSRSASNSSRDHACRVAGHRSRRPNLADILADRAPHPWTLAAFTQYAAQNMCDENIEFITHSRRYREMFESHEDPELLDDRATEKLRKLWMKIVSTYVANSSPREVNLPGDIRARLVALHKEQTIPHPHALQPAVKKIMELIEDSIYFPFVTENKPSSTSNASIGSMPPSPALAPIRTAASGTHQLRDAAQSRRISANSVNRFSTSAIDSSMLNFTHTPLSSVRSSKRSSVHHAVPVTTSHGITLPATMTPSLPLQQPAYSGTNWSHRGQLAIGQYRPPYPHSTASTASVASMNRAPSLDHAYTDDSGISISPASDSMKSPVHSDQSVSPPLTPEDDRQRATENGWKKLGRGIASLGTVKRRTDLSGTTTSKSPGFTSAARPKIPRQRTATTPGQAGIWYR